MHLQLLFVKKLNRLLVVLARVQSFLPQLEASNAILAQRAEKDPQSIDMEHIEDETAQYIEMVWRAFHITINPMSLTR